MSKTWLQQAEKIRCDKVALFMIKICSKFELYLKGLVCCSVISTLVVYSAYSILRLFQNILQTTQIEISLSRDDINNILISTLFHVYVKPSHRQIIAYIV